MARLDQKRDALPPTTTLVDALTGGGSDYVTINGERRHVVGYMKDFLFGPEQARTPIEKLSGGERGRLMLARALAAPSNLIVLDEPTNDLDVETLDLLQELLGDYKGTILIVSHDRDFLDRVATSVIVSEGNGRWLEYAGGYSDMVAQRGYGLSGPAAAPPPKAEKTEAKAKGEAQRSASCRSTTSARSNACPSGWTRCAPRSTRSKPNSATPTSPAASRPPSRRRRTGTARPARRWRRRKTSGLRLKSCAKAWKGKGRRRVGAFSKRGRRPRQPRSAIAATTWRLGPPHASTPGLSHSA